jgi:iron(III) transport system substrate-binding protein
MKKLSLWMITLSSLFLITGCQFGNDQEERSITLYSERHYDTDQSLYDLFEETYGIKVNVISDEADKLISRLQNEGEDTEADLLMIADAGRLERAKSLDLFQSIESETLNEQIPSSYRDESGLWFGLTRRARVFVYHPDRVSVSELSTYEDLTDPKWKGRIVTRSATNIYTQSLMASMIAIKGETQARLWAEGMVANFARDPQGNDRDQAKAVVSGVADLAIMNTYYIGRMLNSTDPYEVEVAQTVRIFFPNQETTGTHVNVSGAGVTKYAKNVSDAVLLLEFLSSEVAQRTFADANFEYPINPNVLPNELLASWGTFVAQDIMLSNLGTHSSKATIILNEIGWK